MLTLNHKEFSLTAPAFKNVFIIIAVNANKLRLSVYADIAGIEVPYPGMKRDACKGKNLTCPVTEGQEIMFVQSFPVRKFFPTVSKSYIFYV